VFQPKQRGFDLAELFLIEGANGFEAGMLEQVDELGAQVDERLPGIDEFGQADQSRLGSRRRGGSHGLGILANHACINRIGLGALAFGPGEVADVGRIENGDRDGGRMGGLNQKALVATGGFQREMAPDWQGLE